MVNFSHRTTPLTKVMYRTVSLFQTVHPKSYVEGGGAMYSHGWSVWTRHKMQEMIGFQYYCLTRVVINVCTRQGFVTIISILIILCTYRPQSPYWFCSVINDTYQASSVPMFFKKVFHKYYVIHLKCVCDISEFSIHTSLEPYQAHNSVFVKPYIKYY